MKTITLRGLDEVLAKKLKQEAEQQGKSLNQLILDTLKERLGLKKLRKFSLRSTTTWTIYLGNGLKRNSSRFKAKSIQSAR